MKTPLVILHGLALNNWWTAGIAHKMNGEGYDVHNVTYPSRTNFDSIIDDFLKPLIDGIPGDKIHFVAHSMGGLLVRLYAKKYGSARIGRVVMLGTPNNGSEAADSLRDLGLFRWYFGDTGQGLGTTENDVHFNLGPVEFECGVIAGSCSWLHFPIGHLTGIPTPNDGIVSVESTKVEGMTDHIVLNLDHSLMAWSPEAWRHITAFLKAGHFAKDPD